MMFKKQNNILFILLACLVLVFILSFSVGAASISPLEIFYLIANKFGLYTNATTGTENAIFWGIRLPRTILSLLVGGILAISGAAMQGLFRNPLADPSVIGISAGAALAAALGIVLFNSFNLPIFSAVGISGLSIFTFLGATLVAFLVLSISTGVRSTSVFTMLLAGIAFNALAGAGTGLMTYFASDAEIRSLAFWTLGSLGGATWLVVAFTSAVFVLCFFILFPMAKSLNALALGEEEAGHLGIPVNRMKIIIVLFTALGVGMAVAFCGMIGFIGLVVPHLLRLIGGNDHRYLLLTAPIGGAVLLCLADALSRTIFAPAELPVGIITAVLGAPFFLALLIQHKKQIA